MLYKRFRLVFHGVFLYIIDRDKVAIAICPTTGMQSNMSQTDAADIHRAICEYPRQQIDMSSIKGRGEQGMQ